jgi:hypothetical protein
MTHLEDKPKSGAFKVNRWLYHYATLCGLSFPGGGHEHTLADPGAAPTCPGCKAIAERRVNP